MVAAPASPLALLMYMIAAVASGVGIGATGIGGVLLVPLLLLTGVPVVVASPAVLASLLLTGVVALYANWCVVPRTETALAATAAIPGAIIGSLLFPLIPALGVSFFITFVAAGSGLHAVFSAWRVIRQGRHGDCAHSGGSTRVTELHHGADEPAPSASGTQAVACGAAATSCEGDGMSVPTLASPTLAFALPTSHALGAGFVVGFCSILTSTGGPFIAMPLLFYLHPTLPPKLVVALAQALMLPVSACSLLVFSLGVGVDLGLACAIGVACALGVPAGVRLGRRAKPAHLKLAIGLVLLSIGLSTCWKLVRGAGEAGRTDGAPAPMETGGTPASGPIAGEAPSSADFQLYLETDVCGGLGGTPTPGGGGGGDGNSSSEQGGIGGRGAPSQPRRLGCGTIVINVTRAWAPRGAERLHALASEHFFDGAAFFRVVPHFVVQFGLAAAPERNMRYADAPIPDDAVHSSNRRGTLSFAATSQPNSRTTQLFINLADNAFLDAQRFAPVGRVVLGMEVVDRIANPGAVDQGGYRVGGDAWLRAHVHEPIHRVQTTHLVEPGVAATR